MIKRNYSTMFFIMFAVILASIFAPGKEVNWWPGFPILVNLGSIMATLAILASFIPVHYSAVYGLAESSDYAFLFSLFLVYILVTTVYVSALMTLLIGVVGAIYLSVGHQWPNWPYKLIVWFKQGK